VVNLTRTVRFCLDGHATVNRSAAGGKHNSFSAWPAMRGLGRYYELHVRCRGEVDPATGYFINIKHIDAAVRASIVPFLDGLLAEGGVGPGGTDKDGSAALSVSDGPGDSSLTSSADSACQCHPGPDDQPMGDLMRQMMKLLQPALKNTVVDLRFQFTPFHSLSIRSETMGHVLIRQQFEFSAAHRLHVPALSDDENRAAFGKCNNPSGHGHNYRVEVCVRAPIDPQGRLPRVEELDELVDRSVIQKLDHKHLNIDVPQFAKVNPSVENIAMVIHEMLTPALPALGVELDEVSVWETGKTMCTYRGKN